MERIVGYRGLGVSEFVGVGHPDKMADYIADYLLDCILLVDGDARAGLEVMVSENTVFVCGEYHCKKKLPRSFFRVKVEEALRNINHAEHEVLRRVVVDVSRQSPEICSKCFNEELLCPDQGIAWGYATRETGTYMPKAHEVGQKLLRAINDLTERDPKLVNDFKLVVLEDDGLITNVTCSIKHSSSLNVVEVRRRVLEGAVDPVLATLDCEDSCVAINIGGAFPMEVHSDCGVTNRKIIVDSYGGNVEHGGGGYSGKDLTKPDRLLAYYARYVAINVVASGLTPFCKVKVVYFYSDSWVNLIEIETSTPNYSLKEAVDYIFSDSYEEIHKMFKHFKGFSTLAKYGHFGCSKRDCNPPWERTDRVEELLKMYQEFGGRLYPSTV